MAITDVPPQYLNHPSQADYQRAMAEEQYRMLEEKQRMMQNAYQSPMGYYRQSERGQLNQSAQRAQPLTSPSEITKRKVLLCL